MARKHRFLKAAVLAAAAGTALYWLRSRKQEHEHTKGPEAEFDAAAEAPTPAPACDIDETPAAPAPDPETPPAPAADDAEAEPDPEPAPAEAAQPQPAPKAPVYRPVRPQEGGPNVNPVEHHTPAPPVVDGKVDPTQIAAPEDFADWDDLGCQG